MARSLDKRYGVRILKKTNPTFPKQTDRLTIFYFYLQRLTEWFYKPYAKMILDHPHVVQNQPFGYVGHSWCAIGDKIYTDSSIKVKEIGFSYHVEKVFNVDIPALQHGNDGLIYTCVSTPYTPGTDTNMWVILPVYKAFVHVFRLKWKPPSENSIDFKLVLRFPPTERNPTLPDFLAKPLFLLHAWHGGEGKKAKYEEYDSLYVTDEEWEEWVAPLPSDSYLIASKGLIYALHDTRNWFPIFSPFFFLLGRLKRSGEQVDDRTVEVHWDPVLSHWRMMRFRDDKPYGNHISVVENILQSIADGVEKETVIFFVFLFLENLERMSSL
jgi:mRNA guanylyltransferase